MNNHLLLKHQGSKVTPRHYDVSCRRCEKAGDDLAETLKEKPNPENNQLPEGFEPTAAPTVSNSIALLC